MAYECNGKFSAYSYPSAEGLGKEQFMTLMHENEMLAGCVPKSKIHKKEFSGNTGSYGYVSVVLPKNARVVSIHASGAWVDRYSWEDYPPESMYFYMGFCNYTGSNATNASVSGTVYYMLDESE